MDTDSNRAITFLADRRFHQIFSIPAASRASGTSIKATYSDVGCQQADAPVLLLLGGVFGGRWLGPAFDEIAAQKGVRVICIDRPGMGGSTIVEIEEKINTTIEIITLLLMHLSIPHVALAAHCAGTIPLLNLLVRHRSLLDPVAPYIAILAPWVHPSQSGVKMMTSATWVPAQLISQFHHVIRFGNAYIAPMIGFSSRLSVGSFAGGMEEGDNDRGFKERVENLNIDYIFAEETSGGSQDSVICLRKAGKRSWGAFESYVELVPRLAAVEAARAQRCKMRVEVFHAESDALVGKGGRRYWDECWGTKRRGEDIEYESQIVAGADHDGLCAPKNGAIGQILDAVAHRAGS